MAQWERMGPILAGGDVSSLVFAADGIGSGQILAGTAVGLYRSKDNGQSWTLISGELGLLMVLSVVAEQPGSAGTTIIAGGAPGLVARSADGGKTWEAIAMGFPDVTVMALAMSPAFSEDGLVLAGTAEDGIYRSTTGGRHWDTANFGLYELTVWSLAISPAWEADQTAFAVVGDHLFRTTNGARSWKPVGGGLGSMLPQVAVVSPGFGQDGTALLGTEGDGIWWSGDGGETWAAGQGSEGTTVNCLTYSSAHAAARTVYAGTVKKGVLHSPDGGRSWEQLAEWDGPGVLSLAEAVAEDGRILLAGVRGEGVYRLAERGQDWQWSSDGLTARDLTMMAATAGPEGKTEMLAAGETGLLVSSRDGGRHWEPVHAPRLSENEITCLALSPTFDEDRLALAGTKAGIVRSSDGGASWVPADVGGVDEIRGLVFSPAFPRDSTTWACTASGRLLRSGDGGRTWGGQEGPFAGEELTSIVLSPSYPADRTILLASVVGDPRGTTVRLWRSVDDGVHSEPIWEHSCGYPRAVLAVERDGVGSRMPYDGCFIGAGGEIFSPMQAGKDSWVAHRLPDEQARVLALLVTPRVSGRRTVLAGTARGMFVSRDDGRTWERPAGGPGVQPVPALALSPSYEVDRSVWVLAVGGALWRYAEAQ